MFSSWNNIVISDINWIMYVPPGTRRVKHTNRPFHGIVLNDSTSKRNYYFSDGTILKTKENDIFYLPKGSSYHVKTLAAGGCYAINIVADINDVPFTLSLKNPENIRKIFKNADKTWISKPPFFKLSALKSAYDIILNAIKEEQNKYIPTYVENLLSPAIEIINRQFTDNSLKISELSRICGISEAYFRRIFINIYGVSPKEYILKLRINYAKQLLLYGQLSIQEIAAACGFSEPCHFSREFKKRVGISPREFSDNNSV